MNSPKLTNALLIVLLAINSLFLTGWAISACHERHFAMYHQYHGRFHDSKSFHNCFGACRSYHGGCCAGFGNYRRPCGNNNTNAIN